MAILLILILKIIKLSNILTSNKNNDNMLIFKKNNNNSIIIRFNNNNEKLIKKLKKSKS